MRSERVLAGLAMLWIAFALSCSSDSNTGPVGPTQTTLRAPSDLYVSRVSPDSIRIAWSYKTENAHGIRIERSVGNTSSFALQDTVLTNVKSYVDIGDVSEGTTYYYRVRAYRGSFTSDPSETVWAIAATDGPPTTPSSPDPPYPPPDPNFEVPAGNVTLSWTSTDPDPDDQVLFDVWFGRFRNEMALVASGSSDPSVTINEPVVVNAHYFWRVVARDSKGAMRYSPLWGFNTTVERVTIPPDSASTYIIMGSRDRVLPSGDSNPAWHPGNPVRVDRFEMDRYDITNQQFADFLNLSLSLSPPQIFYTGGGVYDPGKVILFAKTSEMSDNSQLTYDHDLDLFLVVPGKENFPAIEVTWYGAKAYADFIGRRLPTEAEWELAARGNAGELGDSTFTVVNGSDTTQVTVGFGRSYPWGEEFDRHRCNYLGSGDPYEGKGRVTSTPVGFFDGESHGGFGTLDGSSPYGLQDMAGNVWNWCDDWYGPYQAPHMPPTQGLYKIIRGGSWQKGPDAVVSWNRSFAPPDGADWAIGFRTVKSMP